MKYITKLKILAGLVLLTGLAFLVKAQQYAFVDGLGGNQAVFITNNVTVLYGDSMVGITNANGVCAYSLTNTYVTNFIGGSTLFTNSATTFPKAWVDMPFFADRNGKTNDLSISVSMTGNTSRSTNTCTFVFVKLMQNAKGTVYPSTLAADKWTNVIAGVASGQSGYVTPIPSGMVQGAWGCRLSSLTLSDASAASSQYLQSLGVTGYRP